MWRAGCTCGPAEFVVHPFGFDDEVGVLVYPDGRATNRFADGTAGIGTLRGAAAEACDEAHCPQCGTKAVWVPDGANATPRRR